jgi:branched-chain amino acid transport system substrate-binding protein
MILVASAASAIEPIRVGVSGPFTGGSSPMGIAMRDGIRLAAQEINDEGGILGRPVQLVERDDEARPERGALVVQELINREKIVAGLGIVNTGVALASQRYYQQARIPMITSVATGSVITKQFLPPQYADNYIFRVSAPDTVQAAMIIEEAVVRRQFRKLAILHDSTNYGQLGREDLERALDRHGIKPVAVERFNIGDVDMTAQLTRARAAGAEVILTYGLGPELAHLANNLFRLDWKVPWWAAGPCRCPTSSTRPAPTPRAPACPRPSSRRATPRVARPSSTNTAAPGASSEFPCPRLPPRATTRCSCSPPPCARPAAPTGPPARALESLKEKVDGLVMTYHHPFSKTDHETIDSTRILVIGEIRNAQVVFAYDEDRKRTPSTNKATAPRAVLPPPTQARAPRPRPPSRAVPAALPGATCAPQRRRSQRCVIARLHPGQPSPRLPDTQKYPQKLGSLYCTIRDLVLYYEKRAVIRLTLVCSENRLPLSSVTTHNPQVMRRQNMAANTQNALADTDAQETQEAGRPVQRSQSGRHRPGPLPDRKADRSGT